ncbi:MAG: ABC transporter substrate-binding protein [Desertimonas sp.]
MNTRARIPRYRALALTVAVAFAAPAFGGKAPESRVGAVPASADDTTPSDDAALDPDATLRVDLSIDLTNLDPHKSQYSFDMSMLEPIYDRLFDVDGSGEVVPMLAEAYEFDEAGTSLVLTLREDVTFHDGAAFDAEAVKANIERAQTVEGSAVAPDLDGVTGVEVVDPTHVRLTLAEADASLIASLASRAGAMISPAAFDTDLSQTEAGAGPYTMVEYAAGASMTYERYDDYWDPAAAGAARVEMRVQPDPTTRLNALRSGQTDVSTAIASQYDEIEGLDGLVVTASPGTVYNQLLLNRTRSEFGDIRVRQALYHAIDRQAICDGVLFGLCDLSVQPLVPGHFGYNPDRPGDYYTYDPDRARELLAEAGLDDGFSFELMTPAGLPPYPDIAQVLQAQLAEVGIDARLSAVDPAQMGERMLVNLESDALLGGLPGIGDPSRIYADNFLSDSFNNPGGNTTERMEELYVESISTFDPDERAEVIRQAQAELVDEVLVIVIVVPNSISVTSDQVVGYDAGSVRGYISIRGVGIAA